MTLTTVVTIVLFPLGTYYIPFLPLALAFEVCLAGLMLLVAAPVDLALGLMLIVATPRALWPPTRVGLPLRCVWQGSILIVAAPVDLVLGLTLGSYPSNSY